jgi:protein-S-isoprenylcysteine O-methyltransferase Ste14
MINAAMIQLLLFILSSIVIFLLSRRSLRNKGHHGFYRFFAFEAVVLQIILNLPRWFVNPFAWTQCVSWILLFLSIPLVLSGFSLLRKAASGNTRNDGKANFSFENTGRLVTTGPYRLIRHPMYASLLLLTWGSFFKQPSIFGVMVSSAASVLLVLTARVEERENVKTFGKEYRAYMKTSRMFIPYLW